MNSDDALAGLVAIIEQAHVAEVDHMREIAQSLLTQLQEVQEECEHWRSIARDYAEAEALRFRASDRYYGQPYGRGSM